jgi:O-antigen/teichoic acid export membrane protein
MLFAAQGFGAATRMLADGDGSAAGDLYHHLTKIGLVLSLPAVLVLLAFPEAVLRMLYGASFPLNPSWVWVLLFAFSVNMVFGMNGLFLGATGRGKEIAITGAASLAAMVVSALVLVPAFGGLGAAAATAIAYVVLNITTAWGLYRTTRIRPFPGEVGRTLALSLLPIAIVLVVRNTLAPTEAWQAAAWSLGAWGAWVALLIGLGVLRDSDWKPLLTSLRPRKGDRAP